MERVRFVSSGTEAAMSAVRVARAFTGRDRIIKFEGCYHGHADAFLVKAGSGATDARHADEPRRAGGGRGRHAARALQRPRVGRRAVRRARGRRSPRSSSSRSPATWASCRRPTAFSQGLRERCTRARHPADLRRGDLRLPRVGRRRAGGLRRPPGPDLPRQDHRRRPAGRRLRRPRGRSWRWWRRRDRSIRRARCREIRWR